MIIKNYEIKRNTTPLFKYRCWEEPNKDSQYQRRILTDNEIYLASANQFNDPFDASLPYIYKEEDLTPENIFLKLLKNGRELYPHLTDTELHEKCFERQRLNLFEDKQYLSEFQNKLKEQINKEVGVLSLSSKKDKLLMWSHYSNSHQGFCVGLDKFMLFDIIRGVFGKVTYRSEFPKADLFDDETPKNLIQILTTKSNHWKYENEYRMTKLRRDRNTHYQMKLF
jgi:hypothetical protein